MPGEGSLGGEKSETLTALLLFVVVVRYIYLVSRLFTVKISRMSPEAIKELSSTTNSDVYIFNAVIDDNSVDRLIHTIKQREEKNENCYLFLTTNGGDPDAGYRMARFIQKTYKKFILCLYGNCKSTGTLIALGADEIAMGDFAELGPLDIQLTKEDELSSTSGLSYLQSLNSLYQQAFNSFEDTFLRLKGASGNLITTKTAAEIATNIAVGIISPISEQLDPIKLGEVQRAMRIAKKYGDELCPNEESSISKLITSYPSHSCVIDYEEVKNLFQSKKVRRLEELEEGIEEYLHKKMRRQDQNQTIFDLLTVFDSEEEDKERAEKQKTRGDRSNQNKKTTKNDAATNQKKRQKKS